MPVGSKRSKRGVTRRRFIHLGCASLMGASLQAFVNSDPRVAHQTSGFGRANRFLFVFLQGGPSHIDLWDPKPEAPANIRGEFKAIRTSVSGIQLTEVMPKLARVINRATLIRSCSYAPTGLFHHTAAIYETMTGHRPRASSIDGQLDAPSTDDAPCIGAHVTRLLPRSAGTLPFVVLPMSVQDSQVVGKGSSGGFYGPSFNPVFVRAREIRNQHIFHLGDGKVDNCVFSNVTLKALDVSREPSVVREAYGPHAFGASLLAARRLLEAGSRVVQVSWPAGNQQGDGASWDTHTNNFRSLKNRHAPRLDAGLSSLLADLDSRGILEDTIVLVLGEFGRGPKLGVSTSGNATSLDGRDHWPYCYTAMMAGAGIRRGYVYGESDSMGAYPRDQAVHPAQLLATVYHSLGIPWDHIVRDQRGDPHQLTRMGPVLELFG